MPFFHLRSLPGTAWPSIPVHEVSQVWTAYQELDRSQWLSPEELEARQLAQLRALLLHCYHEVPYYRRLLIEADIGDRPIASLAEFRRLPLLTRELYQTNAEELLAHHLPRGIEPTGEAFTSGTNGVPIRVLKTNLVALWWYAFSLRDLEWSNLDPRGRLACIRLLAMSRDKLPALLEGIAQPHWNEVYHTLLECGPAFAMDVRQDPRRQLAWLRRLRPDYLVSIPTNLEILASLVQESGQRLPELRAIQAVGEPLSVDARQRIETGFGVPVKNLYSSTEAGYMASPCPLGHGLHVHSENILAEVLDADNRPCLPGQTGRLIFTTLHNFRAPFVRYDILDDVTLAPGPCPCGRGLPLWTRVDGRRHSSFHLPDGQRKSSMGVTLGIRRVGGCLQFQIVQRAKDHVVLRVVPDGTWRPENAALMRQVVQEEFAAPIRVDVEEKPFLERPPGGKLKIVVIEVEATPPSETS